jgi:phenylpyruvate tautomerase
MPNLTLDISLPSIEAEDKTKLFSNLTKVIAELSGKPEAVVQIVVRIGALIAFGGESVPSVFGVYSQIGQLSLENQSKMIEAISEHCENLIHIPSSKVFVTFHELDANHWGYKGKLVSQLS